jgi:hypothetical protein
MRRTCFCRMGGRAQNYAVRDLVRGQQQPYCPIQTGVQQQAPIRISRNSSAIPPKFERLLRCSRQNETIVTGTAGTSAGLYLDLRVIDTHRSVTEQEVDVCRAIAGARTGNTPDYSLPSQTHSSDDHSFSSQAEWDIRSGISFPVLLSSITTLFRALLNCRKTSSMIEKK